MLPPPSGLHLQAAVRALHHGGVIACPTEAVWGLSCDPDNEDAVKRLLQLKNRPVAKGLILDAEKNVSAPSPNGPSAGASGTARRAQGAALTAPQD